MNGNKDFKILRGLVILVSTKKVSEVKSLSPVRLFETPWTIAYQAPPSMGFSRQEYWSGLPFPSPRDLPDPGIEPRSPTFQADALTSVPPGKPLNTRKKMERILIKQPTMDFTNIL